MTGDKSLILDCGFIFNSEGASTMFPVQSIEEVFSEDKWRRRVEQDPKRIYAFLLCTDENETFIRFIQTAWRTLDKLAGKPCDVFTLERPPSHQNASYDLFLYSEDRKSLVLPDRTECITVKDKLFEKPREIVFPGFVVFPSTVLRECLYYNCMSLDEEHLSYLFQKVLGAINEAYSTKDNRFGVFDHFRQLERERIIKERVIRALTTLSLKDIFDILTTGIGLAIPKGGN